MAPSLLASPIEADQPGLIDQIGVHVRASSAPGDDNYGVVGRAHHIVDPPRAIRATVGPTRRTIRRRTSHHSATIDHRYIAFQRQEPQLHLLEHAYQKFLAASTGGLEALGEVIRLRENHREGLFYLRNTCCLYYTSAEATKCSSCCLDPAEDRIAAYRRVLADGVVPH